MTSPSSRPAPTPAARLKALKAFAGTVAIASLVLTTLVAAVRQTGGLQDAELDAYDQMMRVRPDPGPDDRLLVVGISEADIQTYNQYPIHDGTLAQLLQTLERYEPRVIGLDIARDVPQGEGRQALLDVLQSDRIIAACTLSAADDPGLPPPPGVPPDRIAFADLPQDPQGIVRRSILVSTPAASTTPPPSNHICNQVNLDNQLPSLSLALALRYLEAEGVTNFSEASPGVLQLGQALFHALPEQAGGYRFTGAQDFQVLLNYRSAQGARTVSLQQVLNGDLAPEWVKDRVVLIGYTSEIAKDLFYTPFSGGPGNAQPMPGAMVHAQSVSQIISAALGDRPLIWYWPTGVEFLWLLGWSVVGGAIAWFVRKLWRLVLAGWLAISALWGACFLLFLQGGWVPMFPAVLTLLATAVAVVLLERANEGGYTQAIYEQVKEKVQGSLKPTIEIDEEKRAKQVAEITESGYFQDLVQRAKEIREKRSRGEE